jgi:hypothetical protein
VSLQLSWSEFNWRQFKDNSKLNDSKAGALKLRQFKAGISEMRIIQNNIHFK